MYKYSYGPNYDLGTAFRSRWVSKHGLVFAMNSRNLNPQLSSGSTSSSDCVSSETRGGHHQPQVSVLKQGGVFEVRASMKVDVHPECAYAVIKDYKRNAEVFKSISRVEVEEEEEGKVVTQYAGWRFLLWSGTYSVRFRVQEDIHSRSLSFQLDKPGTLKVFKGGWRVATVPNCMKGGEQQLSSEVTLHQEILPALVPPGPLASYVARAIAKQVKGFLIDLTEEVYAFSASQSYNNQKEDADDDDDREKGKKGGGNSIVATEKSIHSGINGSTTH